MALLPHAFTKQQKRRACEYYEPRTAHDSSLSYAPHGWLLAQLQECEKAYAYFEKSALLDVEDRQMNTISGIHFANFGGTWQMVFSGFFGITQSQGTLYVDPHLPKEWQGFSAELCYQGKRLSIRKKNNLLRCDWLDPVQGEKLPVCLAGTHCALCQDQPYSEVSL